MGGSWEGFPNKRGRCEISGGATLLKPKWAGWRPASRARQRVARRNRYLQGEWEARGSTESEGKGGR